MASKPKSLESVPTSLTFKVLWRNPDFRDLCRRVKANRDALCASSEEERLTCGRHFKWVLEGEAPPKGYVTAGLRQQITSDGKIRTEIGFLPADVRERCLKGRKKLARESLLLSAEFQEWGLLFAADTDHDGRPAESDQPHLTPAAGLVALRHRRSYDPDSSVWRRVSVEIPERVKECLAKRLRDGVGLLPGEGLFSQARKAIRKWFRTAERQEPQPHKKLPEGPDPLGAWPYVLVAVDATRSWRDIQDALQPMINTIRLARGIKTSRAKTKTKDGTDIWERRLQIWDWRFHGVSFGEIGRRMGISGQNASNELKRLFETVIGEPYSEEGWQEVCNRDVADRGASGEIREELDAIIEEQESSCPRCRSETNKTCRPKLAEHVDRVIGFSAVRDRAMARSDILEFVADQSPSSHARTELFDVLNVPAKALERVLADEDKLTALSRLMARMSDQSDKVRVQAAKRFLAEHSQ